MSALQLIPCPFCATPDPEMVRSGNSRRSCIIACTFCGCTLETNEEDEHCGELWNERTEIKE